MSDNLNTVLGYNQSQAEAVSFELQNAVMDLITVSAREGADTAVNTVVTGLALRIAILDGLVTPEEAEKLVADSEGDFGNITEELHKRAVAKFLAE